MKLIEEYLKIVRVESTITNALIKIFIRLRNIKNYHAHSFEIDTSFEERVINTENRSQEQQNNPLHGITLEKILTELVNTVGWKEMNRKIEIDCFFRNPSIKSSLIFLRKNNWVRTQVEQLYIELILGSKEINNDHHE